MTTLTQTTPAITRRIREGQTVTSAELLTVALGVSAEHAQTMAELGWRELRRASPSMLKALGLTPTQVARWMAIRASYDQLAVSEWNERLQIRSPADVANLLMVEMSHLDQEHLRTVLLDTKNRVQAVTTVYVGSVNTALIRIGEVFKEAIRRNSTAMIVSHNHPSGDPTPSSDDIAVTKQIVAAGKLLDVETLDHLIIGDGRYVSLRERGLGF